MTPELQQKIEELADNHFKNYWIKEDGTEIKGNEVTAEMMGDYLCELSAFKNGIICTFSSLDLLRLAGYWTDEAMIDFHNFIFRHPKKYMKMGEYLREFKQTLNTNYQLTGEVNDGWVRVEDRLPEDDEHVLVSIENGWTTLMAVIKNGEWFCYYKDSFSTNANDPNKVTHWQPLPSPPKI